MTLAADIIKGVNANALVAYENSLTIGIEDVIDPDGRMYRLEYKSTHTGEQAVSYCLHVPWDISGRRYWDGHMSANGLICTGAGIHALCPCPDRYEFVKASPYPLGWIIQRSRFWCTAYSVYRETGVFPHDCRL